MTSPSNLLSTAELPPERQVRKIRVVMLPLQHGDHLENFADNFGAGWLDRQNKQMRLQFNLVALFANAKVDRLCISILGEKEKIPLSPTCIASRGIEKKHPKLPWSAKSRFVVDETIELPQWAIGSNQFELFAEVAGKLERIGVINSGEGPEQRSALPAASTFSHAAASIYGKMPSFVHTTVGRIKEMNRLFLFTVILPTLLSAVYFGFIASDVYISESQFVVRSPSQQTPSPFGSILQGVGLPSSQNDSYSVQNFILSRDALLALDKKMDLRKALASKDVDIFSRFAGLYWDTSFEALYKYYQRVVVDAQIDTTSSIVTLDTRAFTAEDSFRANQILLEKSEELVNQLSERARQDMIDYAIQEVEKAEIKDKEAALALAKIQTGSTRDAARDPSLVNKVTEFQRLALEKDVADRILATAMSSLDDARNQALHKQLYLERVVQPIKPDWPAEPRRLRAVAAVFVLGLIAWGILTMLIAGIKEHQD